MINKKEYEKGIRCKGICDFCKDRLNCYQGMQHTKVDNYTTTNLTNLVHTISNENICPNCGTELQLMCYTVNPPIHEAKCPQCGYIKPNITSNIDLEELNTDNDLYFAKVESKAIVPSKREEDAGYDIYTCETETIVINPNSTRLIDTGIAIACSQNYFPKFFDKGGMGSKGIIVGAGVGDSGYRDKYFIPLINTNDKKYVVITNQSQEEIDKSNYFDPTDNKFKYSSAIETYIKLEETFDKENFNFDFYIDITDDFILKENCIIKPLNKAITQFVMLPVPKMNVKEITYEELKNIKSERGLGKLGSSGK